MKTIAILAIAFVTAIASGCARSNALYSVADFQGYYTNTSWYFSKYQAHPADLPGFRCEDNHGMQAFLTSPSGTHMIYGELQPSGFMKSFRGSGTLARIPDISDPIFQIDCDYTQRDPTKILLIAFVAGRAIQIEASHNGTNRAEILLDALGVATQSYQQLLTRAPKN